MTLVSSLISTLTYWTLLSLAALVPTAPGPGESFNTGTLCIIKWSADVTGSWTNVTVDLMSGSNSNMSLVVNVATMLDGTDASLSPYSWTCPKVKPYSAIYFYQFSSADDPVNTRWTTRFTIASSDGKSILPEYTEQANGDEVPWGIGALISESPQNVDAEEHIDDKTDNDSGSESSQDAKEFSATGQATSTRMTKLPKPTEAADPKSTLGPSLSCPSTGSSLDSASCIDVKAVNEGFRSMFMMPVYLCMFIIGLCTL